MPWFVYPFGSGAAFFLGVGFMAISLLVFVYFQRRWVKVLATWIAIVGLVFISASSTPLPYWLYAAAAVVTILWLMAERSARPRLRDSRRALQWTVSTIWLAATAIEFPYHVAPTVPSAGRPVLYVLGDSISAGINEHEEAWPQMLGRKRSVEVVNVSRVGASVTSARRQASQLPSTGGLVLIEIGGNDLLGATSTAEFEKGLDLLLSIACVPGRTVIMFELPLPPFCNEYGRAQRRLAAKYRVSLIPKRILLSVLMGDDATSDSLHLTHAGHERMADSVWAVIRGAYPE
jgi:acyl-CoA thioesterase-1